MFDLNRKDTICALATAFSPSAIAIIRVSGLDSAQIKTAIFKPKKQLQKDFVATLGDIVCPHSGETIDEGLCTFFPNKKSYTGEESFELSVHGAPVIIERILQALTEAGARLAQPGEFTLRAVLTGKLDLCAAEAVSDVIHAQSVKAAQTALKTLKGGLKKCLQPTREILVDILSELEARLDFPEEKLGEANQQVLSNKLERACACLNKLLQSAVLGRRLTQGARVVLYGEPNVGKSTLLNALVGEDRAIVHENAGTTRDVLEADFDIKGVPIKLVDVAGIRDERGLDPVEVIGINRAKTEFIKADVVVWMREHKSNNFDQENELSFIDDGDTDNLAPILSVVNKADLLGLQASLCDKQELISAKTGQGLNNLKQKIYELLVGGASDTGEVLLSKVRQKEEVQSAYAYIKIAQTALENHQPDEIVASELRQAGNCLDRLLGQKLSEDILEQIFSRFCVGK